MNAASKTCRYQPRALFWGCKGVYFTLQSAKKKKNTATSKKNRQILCGF